MTYQDALAYLDRLLEPRPTPTPYAHVKLERMRHLCGLLGHPERTFPAVLVAGTKGKGSTAAMIAAVTAAARSRVGLYTKPHLVDVRERVRIDGTLISPDAFAALLGEIRTAIDRGAASPGPGWPPTYFEVTAALAFLHFARERVDLGVVEVGIGGRLDACNVVEPSVSVITTIGYDHTEIVGARLRQIAAEDVGIMRPSGRVVTVPQREAAAVVIRQAAAAHGADLIRVGQDVRYRTLRTSTAGTRFTVRGRLQTYRDLSVPLLGRHQALNAATAIGAAEALAGADARFVFSEAAVRTGLATLRWPARIEVIRDRPMVIVDVAHNAVSFRALRAVLDEIFRGRRLVLVLGVLGDKDLASIVRIIAGRAAVVIATRPNHVRASPPEAVAAAFGRWVSSVSVVEEPVEAIERALAIARPDDLICATGSFHVAGPIRAHLLASSEFASGRADAGVPAT